MIRRRVIARGRVQGVFFRDTIRRRALAEDVTGWVRNTAEGAVEAVFEGEAESVARLVDFVRTGPRGAHVDSVEVFEQDPEERGGAFEIRS